MPNLPPLPGTGTQTQPSNPDQFTFLVAGDNRPAQASDPQPPIPGKILAAARTANVSFVIWTGDTIYGKDTTDGARIKSEYQEFLGIAAQAGVPVYNAPGNHEMDDKSDVPNSQMLAWYVKYMAPQYGAVNIGNARFIAVNSEEMPPGTQAGGSGDKQPGYVGNKQFKLLEADLKANANVAHIFVFMHHPLKPYKKKDGFEKENGKALLKLLEKYHNVSFVFCGHEHMYYNPQSSDGLGQPGSHQDPSTPPTYIVTGGAGAPLKDAPGGFYNYVIVTVDKDKVSAQMFKVE
jgi:3',5'-cyclic AMP phosphodiesterase CpdA